MRASILLVGALLIVSGTALLGCKGEMKGSLGEKAGNMVNDERVLKEVTAATNRVVASAGDCDAIKGALPEASRALADALPKLRTPTGRATLEALRTRVNAAAQMCP
jgi:hypothetical protein